MPKRSLYEMVFGKKEQKGQEKYQILQLLNEINPIWSTLDTNLYRNNQVRSCIDAIARNTAKLNPKHLRYYYDNEQLKLDRIYGRVQRLIAEKPNEVDNAYNFYYKVVSQLLLNNNAYVFISRDNEGLPIGLYPLLSGNYQLLEYKNEIYIRFMFQNGGQTYTASLKDDVIHLKRYYCTKDITGDSNEPLTRVMSIKHIINEGIVNAIKTTQGIKGILKTTKAMLKPEDIKNTRDQFVKDFISNADGSGIGGLDSTTDFKEVNINPQTATDGQVNRVDDEILNYFGINKHILQSDYNEEQWNAFYESVIEPIALEMSLEFTNKIFSIGERYHGNKIVFEANRLQYASTTSKINILKEAGALGLLTINEGREILNLAPVPDGDKRMQSLNYTDIDDNGGNKDEW